jgi:tRNA(Leu) C34 or U34 (ribose-2'-O)-methylase TrmL
MMQLKINVHFPHEYYNPGDIASLIRNISILYGKCNYELNFYNCQHKETKIFKYIIKKCGRSNAEKSDKLKQFFDVNIINTDSSNYIYGGNQKVIFSKCENVIILHIVNDNIDYIFDILNFFCRKRMHNIRNIISNTNTIIYIDNIQYYPNLNTIKKISTIYPQIQLKIKLSNQEFTMKKSQEHRIKDIYELFCNSHNITFITNLCEELVTDKRKYYLVDLDDNAVPCETIKTENNIGFIFGSETYGISQEVYDTVYAMNNYQKIFIESRSATESPDNFTCSSMNLSIAIFSILSIMFYN